MTRIHKVPPRSLSSGWSPGRARTGGRERIVSDTCHTVPSPVHARPDPAGCLRRWLHKDSTTKEAGVLEVGTAEQPQTPAQRESVPNYSPPANLPGTLVENPAVEERAAGPESGSPGTILAASFQRGITSMAEDGKWPKSD